MAKSHDMDHNEMTALLSIQLIISLLVMPMSPLLWLCTQSTVGQVGQRVSRMLPIGWSLFFPLLMSGSVAYLPNLILTSLWPYAFLDAVICTLCSGLAVLFVAVGSYCLSLLVRWGHEYNTSSSVQHPEYANGAQSATTGAQVPTVYPRSAYNYIDDSNHDTDKLPDFSLSDVGECAFILLEGFCVEFAWRAYLLPRLLLMLSPFLALLSMALLVTLSFLPLVLHTVCADKMIYPEALNWQDPPFITRHPPSVLTVFLFVLHQLLMNIALGVLAMLCDFCVWPAVFISLYWSHVARIVSGGMLISSYMPLGMELLAKFKERAGGRKISVAGWVRGAPWKVSCEGLSGCLALTPLLLIGITFLHGKWQQDSLSRKLSYTS